jgi:type VI secretion system FHA domain protein
MSDFKITVTMAGGDGTALSEHACAKEQFTIGRAAGNDAVLPDVEKRVSSKHARIEKAGGGVWQLKDLGSTNGTYLNDRRLEANAAQDLKDGDRIGIGLYLLLFRVEEAEPERTMMVADPARLTRDLAASLPELWSRKAGETVEARQAALKQAVQGALSMLPPATARTVAAQLKARFEVAGGSGEERTTLLRKRDQEVARTEGVGQASMKAVTELSKHFLGEGGFETSAQVELFARLLGQAMEATLDWMSKSLKGRKEFEGQFSADLTMIFSQEKNPLKGGGGPAEMAKFLLDWRSARPVESVREELDRAFKDLTMHQLGLLAGVQESLGAVLKRLDPKSVEEEAKEKGSGGLFSSLEKRAWKRYEEIFHEIFAENSRLFNELIYPNVRKGYLAAHQPRDPKGGP